MIKIGTFNRTTVPTPKPSKHLGKNIWWERIGALWRALGTVGRPEPIKILALLRVAQDLVGLLDLFELLSVTALVWVVLAGKFAMGLFDVLGRGVSRQAEDVVHLILIEN
jgi:hypothetical protein